MKYNTILWPEIKRNKTTSGFNMEIVIHLDTKRADEDLFSKRLLKYLNAFMKKQNPSLSPDKKQLAKNKRLFDKIRNSLKK